MKYQTLFNKKKNISNCHAENFAKPLIYNYDNFSKF